ncbi:MAG: ATP-dependent 6-phosphofructokinase [Clostridia bacterium]|nr:ATP-dependent 6-phosphofructokinase [Clostridia bacterium]
MKKIGVLTSGGDAPGMNSAVMAVAKAANMYGMPLVGIKRGYNGLLRKSTNVRDDLMEMHLDTVLDIADQPGTYLRTARCKEFLDPEVRKGAAQVLKDMEIGGLVVIGGDGSFQGAMGLCDLGVPCIGIPGTIDNDLAYTEITLGYETAVNVCTEAVRAIRATSRSHDRPHVVEVMGRHCGDIALKTACATGAEIVVVPEVEWSVEEVAARLNKQLSLGNTRATIIVAEGCWDSMKPFPLVEFMTEHGEPILPDQTMNTQYFTRVLKYLCKAEVRCTNVGYVQRGKEPVAADSAFAFEAGHLAVKLLRRGISNQVIGIHQGRVFYMPIDEALHERRRFHQDLYDLVNSL